MENNLNICKNEQHWILAIFLVPVIPSSHTLESPSSQKPTAEVQYNIIRTYFSCGSIFYLIVQF